MSILSKKFWKGVAIGGVASAFFISLMHEGVADNLRKKFKMDNSKSDIDLDNLSSEILGDTSEKNLNKSQKQNEFSINQTNEARQDERNKNDKQFNEKISLVEERLKNLSPDSKSN